MSLMQKSFKELTIMTEEVAERFFAAKRMSLSSDLDFLRESEREKLPYDFYLKKVEDAYETLNEREKNLINNEFFFQNYHYWWVGLYSKTSFYRFKRRAMLKFLEAFYHA